LLAAERTLRCLEKSQQHGVLTPGQCGGGAGGIGELANPAVELTAGKRKRPRSGSRIGYLPQPGAAIFDNIESN
jgi:hypothetical protein